MEQAAAVLFWLAFAGVIGASVVFAYELLLRRNIRVNPRLVTFVSLLALTASIGFNSSANKGTPLTGANQLILAAWALLILYFVVEYVFKFENYGMVVVPISGVLMIVAQFVAATRADIAPIPELMSHQMNSFSIGFHVGLIIFANMLFLVGAVVSALYLYQASNLKKHKNTLLTRRLPALANLERLASRLIIVALPIYVAGQTLGIVRAISVDVAGWWADPRIMLSGLVMLIYLLYIILFHRNNVSGQTTAYIAIVGAIAIIVLMVLARLLPVGFHVFGVIG